MGPFREKNETESNPRFLGAMVCSVMWPDIIMVLLLPPFPFSFFFFFFSGRQDWRRKRVHQIPVSTHSLLGFHHLSTCLCYFFLCSTDL